MPPDEGLGIISGSQAKDMQKIYKRSEKFRFDEAKGPKPLRFKTFNHCDLHYRGS